MKLLLDTHILLWWAEKPDKLPPITLPLLSDTANELVVSLVSVWEIQIKLQTGKLKLSLTLPEIIATQQQTNGLRLLPVMLDHLWALKDLPLHHKDPFDRLLIAQAIAEDFVLVSVDPKVSLYPVKVLS